MSGVSAASLIQGGRDVWVDGDYAYIGAGYAGGLGIIDVQEPSDPQEVALLSDGGALDFGRGVKTRSNVAYLACRDSHSFATFDITDPENASLLGSVSTGDGGDLDGARGIDLDPRAGQDYAYVALGHFTAGGDPSQGEGLTVIDISDTSNPAIVTNLNGNDSTGIFAAGDAHYRDGYAYLSGYQDGVLMVFDVSDPTNPSHVNTWDPGIGAARGLDSRDNSVLYINTPSDDAVIAADISDPLNISELDRVSDPRLAGARANSLDGDDLFASARGAKSEVWIDTSTPSDMDIVYSVTDDALTEAYGSFTDGEYVYAAAANSGKLTVMDYER